jgi:hypothetical protein
MSISNVFPFLQVCRNPTGDKVWSCKRLQGLWDGTLKPFPNPPLRMEVRHHMLVLLSDEVHPEHIIGFADEFTHELSQR